GRLFRGALGSAGRVRDPTLETFWGARGDDLRGDRGAIRVVVADDGRGISEPTRLGYGLVGVNERVSAGGGRLSFSSRSEKGFAVTAILPYAAVGNPLSRSLASPEP